MEVGWVEPPSASTVLSLYRRKQLQSDKELEARARNDLMDLTNLSTLFEVEIFKGQPIKSKIPDSAREQVKDAIKEYQSCITQLNILLNEKEENK